MTVSTKASFPRGVHPSEAKELAENAAIEVLPTPPEVQIPMLQHLGAVCESALKPRTEVKVGDVVGNADAFISAPVHATVDGATGRATVTTLPNGRHVAVMPIKAGEEQERSGQALFDDVLGGEWPTDVSAYDATTISKIARDAGLVGLGGAAFPTHVKLAKNDEKPIDNLLINGCECEPYLTSDYRLMLEAPAAVVCGALVAQRSIGADAVTICVEDNKPKAIEALRKAAEGTSAQVRVFKTKYPQGGEKQLILAALGREVPMGGLPLDVGVVVMNVGTCASLARAVVRGKPLTHRVVTVTGAGIRQPKNILAPIGTPYSALIEFCGGLTEDAARVISGGPMMGFTVGDLETPITKGTSGITVLTHQEIRKSDETSCVRCGRCVDVCPLNLVPTKIAIAARMGNTEVGERYYVNACMECGCCAYACPASIPLVQLIRLGKVQAKAKKN